MTADALPSVTRRPDAAGREIPALPAAALPAAADIADGECAAALAGIGRTIASAAAAAVTAEPAAIAGRRWREVP